MSNTQTSGLHEFDHGMYVRNPDADGRQLVCRLSASCGYRTSVWQVDDGSAEEQFYRHKWRAHEPETETVAS